MSETLFMLLGLLTIMLVVVLPFWFFPAAIGFSLARRLWGKQAAKQNTILSLFAVFVSLILMFVLSLLFSLPSSHILARILLVTLPIAALILVLHPIVTYFRNNRRSGICLLDIGYTRIHKFNIVFGTLMVLVLAYVIINEVQIAVNIVSVPVLVPVTNLLIGLSFLVRGVIPIQVRQYGILTSSFTNWHDIKEYYWESDQPSTLTLNRRNELGLLEKIRFNIPLIYKEHLEKILAEKCSKSNTG